MRHAAQKVSELGYNPVMYPLLQVKPPLTEPPLPADDACLILTSQNAARAFANRTVLRHWCVFTVGDATAQLARELGFRHVYSAAGDQHDLTRLLIECAAKDRPLYHATGSQNTDALTTALQTAGFTTFNHSFYSTQPIQGPPDLDFAHIDAVLLYSPLAAVTLFKLDLPLRHARIISISFATHAALQNMHCRAHLIANRPTQAALLAELGVCKAEVNL